MNQPLLDWEPLGDLTFSPGQGPQVWMQVSDDFDCRRALRFLVTARGDFIGRTEFSTTFSSAVTGCKAAKEDEEEATVLLSCGDILAGGAWRVDSTEGTALAGNWRQIGTSFAINSYPRCIDRSYHHSTEHAGGQLRPGRTDQGITMEGLPLFCLEGLGQVGATLMS